MPTDQMHYNGENIKKGRRRCAIYTLYDKKKKDSAEKLWSHRKLVDLDCLESETSIFSTEKGNIHMLSIQNDT
jgi:hypothetical protein